MRSSTAGVLGAAVLAGLIAGAITSAFHFVLAEPVIERAIEQEKQMKMTHGTNAEAPIVSRTGQRRGLVVGLLIYGAVWGALFGIVSLVVESRRQLWDARISGWLLAVVIGWSVAWYPFLKYPANPPGVGESATVAYRQLLYVGFVVLSVAGAALAFFFYGRRFPGRARPVVILYAIYAIALYLAMPANPDPVRVPEDLVWTFRAISLAGLVLFWMALGISFQWLARAAAALAALLILAPLAAYAQEPFPSRPIRVVTVCPRGSTSDVSARPLAAAMAKVLRNPVKVSNVSCPKVGVRPSAMYLVANEAADGYTLLVAVPSLQSMVEAERLFGRTPPYSVDQFVPVALISAPPAIFVVRGDSPWMTLAEFVADARRRPGEISFASGGAFKPPHIATEIFTQAAEIRLKRVDDERHSPVAAILEGRADAGSVGPGALPQIRTGKLRPLAGSGAKRIATLPDLPTFKESGYEVEAYLWAGLFAHHRTPAPVLKTLRDAVRVAVEDPGFKVSMAEVETPVAYLDAPEFQAFLDR